MLEPNPGYAPKQVAVPAYDYAANVPQGAVTESEVAYAARMASESLGRLEKTIHSMADRLEMVLTPDCPQTPSPETASRPTSSRIGTALMQHASQIDNLERYLRSVRDRVAL